MKKIIAALTSLILSISSFATDSTVADLNSREKFNWVEQIVPITFIAGGLALSTGTIKDSIQVKMPRTNNDVDDVIQYVPIAELYMANLFLKDHQNSVWDQTKYLFLSELANGVVVLGLKTATHELRPDGSNAHSFPSGHTSQAFVGATVLYHEYKKSSPILAYSGFLVAGATGALRVTNNKHWVNDVITGAGIGILATNMIYYFKPFKNWQPFKTKSNVSIMPQVYLTENDGVGCSISMGIR